MEALQHFLVRKNALDYAFQSSEELRIMKKTENRRRRSLYKGEVMNPEQIKQAINAIASQLQANPDLMHGQIDLLRAVLPNASEETLRNLVRKVSAPNFNVTSIQKDLEALLRP